MAGGLHAQVGQLTAHLHALGGMDHLQVRQEVDRMRAELTGLQQAHAAAAQRTLVPFTDELLFQYASVFRYYHPLENSEAYMRELELMADYLQKKQEEKDSERAERERLREEAKAQAEFRRELEKLDKERKHLENVRKALLDKGEVEAAQELEAELDKVVASIDGVHQREANIRAGYVYVISNLGAFGPRMVKIGMTRRLHPEERVLELGDASVPFRYDTHILYYSHDAVSLETALHRELSDRRVNQVNMRREFFYATPEEVRELLKKHAGQVLEYVLEPEAAEYRQSVPAQ